MPWGLERVRAALGEPAAPAHERLAELLGAAHRTLKRRSAVFVVSDFVGEPGWERALEAVLVPCDDLEPPGDFDYPPPGMTAADGLARNKLGSYTGFLPAVEAAYRVGNTVVEELVKNWPKYKNQTPAGKP